MAFLSRSSRIYNVSTGRWCQSMPYLLRLLRCYPVQATHHPRQSRSSYVCWRGSNGTSAIESPWERTRKFPVCTTYDAVSSRLLPRLCHANGVRATLIAIELRLYYVLTPCDTSPVPWRFFWTCSKTAPYLADPPASSRTLPYPPVHLPSLAFQSPYLSRLFPLHQMSLNRHGTPKETPMCYLGIIGWHTETMFAQIQYVFNVESSPDLWTV